VNDVTPEPVTAPTTEATPEEPQRQSMPFLVLQFFIFPMAIVAVCVTVFVIFGLISSDARTPRQYLAEARTGGGMFNIKRWQAAYALANALESPKELKAAREDPKFLEEALALYKDTEKGGGDDVLLRRYLALVLGKVGDRRAVPELRVTLQTPNADPQTLIYAAWALGAIGDAAALPELLALSESEDPGLRKTAAHALGAFDDASARTALHRALTDATADVRWNAAVALGRRGDAAAGPVLREMLDRKPLEANPDLSPEQRDDAILQAVVAASTTPDPALVPLLEALRDNDANLRVREAARAALARR
jgi:HEAT repeat protein